MTASALLAPFFPGVSLPDTQVTRLTEDSRMAGEHAVFVCIRGANRDGHDLAPEAYAKGCRLFVTERPLSLPPDAICLLCESTRRMLGLLADAFWGHPSRRIPVIGITGTKGKTTTALLTAAILEEAGIPTGYIGTNGIHFGRVSRETRNSTPDACTLQSALSEMASAGMKAAVLEVSSQALAQERVTGTQFDTVLFTNLYPDHIGPGEHRDMADYRAAKRKLFTVVPSSMAIWNLDDPATPEMREGYAGESGTVSTRSMGATLSASRVRPIRMGEDLGTEFLLHTSGTVLPCRLSLVGEFNVSNALLAMCVATERFGVSPEHALRVLEKVRIPGRGKQIPLPGGAMAIIDYAHNGKSLREMLRSLRPYTEGRLICLFGSVGDRTQMRRRELGEAAAAEADLCILTSDNPGHEDPIAILGELALPLAAAGVPYEAIPDRAEAIRYALSCLQRGDILLLAGKGHEAYQLVGDQKIPFSEEGILKEALLEHP